MPPHTIRSARKAYVRPVVFKTESYTGAQLAYSINQPEAVAIFTNAALLPTLANVLPKTPTLKYIIYDDVCEDHTILDKLQQAREGLRILTLDDLQKLGADRPHEAKPPMALDLAAIVYTSGSSGTPKGVQLTHQNMVSAGAPSRQRARPGLITAQSPRR
jgi:long-chain acyl-CoA synthetase